MVSPFPTCRSSWRKSSDASGKGVEPIVPEFGQFSDTANLLRSGESDVGTCAFASALALRESGNPVYVVAGSGGMGIAQVAAPEIKGWQDLSG